MLTPIEMQGKTFKNGFGYNKDDVETYVREIISNYEILYKENMELSEKIHVLSEGLQYYKSIEKTLQKALVVAQKAAQDTENLAAQKAITIEKEAKLKANEILYDAKRELDEVKKNYSILVAQYETYKSQFKQLAKAQVEFLESAAFRFEQDDYHSIFYKAEERINALGANYQLDESTEQPVTNIETSYTEEELEVIKEAQQADSSNDANDSMNSIDTLEEEEPAIEQPINDTESTIKKLISDTLEKSEQKKKKSNVFEFLSIDN